MYNVTNYLIKKFKKKAAQRGGWSRPQITQNHLKVKQPKFRSSRSMGRTNIRYVSNGINGSIEKRYVIGLIPDANQPDSERRHGIMSTIRYVSIYFHHRWHWHSGPIQYDRKLSHRITLEVILYMNQTEITILGLCSRKLDANNYVTFFSPVNRYKSIFVE